MGRIRILPYRQGSKSAKALSEALGGKVLKLVDSKFKPKPDDICINWGNTTTNDQAIWGSGWKSFLNDGDEIRFVSNKKLFFEAMKENCPDIIPEFWTNKADIPSTAYPVVCRTVLAGHSGEGIHIADTPDDLVDAPLYVKYVKKKEEYRVHVGKRETWNSDGCDGNGEWEPSLITIAVQRKARVLSVPDEEVNWKIRNLAGGFIYQREGFTIPNSCLEIAHRCLRATGLDFGAVDVIWNEHEGKPYVLEVNTAPGLEGQTVEDYAEFFQAFI